MIRDDDGVIWIIETKGREDIQDARKWERLKLWCQDANEQDAPGSIDRCLSGRRIGTLCSIPCERWVKQDRFSAKGSRRRLDGPPRHTANANC